jgi:hypothetical protein
LKRFAYGIILTLFLTSVLAFTPNISIAEASGSVFIRADGSIDPPTEPISTTDNMTYTLQELGCCGIPEV